MKTRLKKNQVIETEGQRLTLANPVAVRYTKIEEIKQEEVQGEHRRDCQDPVERKEVLRLLEEQIDKLEVQEDSLLIEDSFRDDELEDYIPENNAAITAAYATNAVVLRELQHIRKQVEKL